MGQVYLARATGLGGFERQVVVKTLDLSITDDDESFVTMFLDEARLVGALHHQYIAPVYEVGCDDEGRYYLVMDYVHGETTEAVFRASGDRARPIPLPFALTVVSCVANALDYAHNLCAADGTPLDIVHRDISLSNVMVGYDGGVKLIDFGIAKASNRATKTQVGTLKGKIGYLAPEQVLRKHVDHRADIFALGIVLYELTTATRAFRESSDLLTLERITDGEVRPPSQFVPNYPPELERIVLRALQRDPEQRFQDAGTMGRELEALAAKMHIPLGHAPIIDVMTSLFGERRGRRRIARGSNDVTTDPTVTALDDEDAKTPVIALIDEHSATRESVVERAKRETLPLPPVGQRETVAERAASSLGERAQRPTIPIVDRAKRSSSQPGLTRGEVIQEVPTPITEARLIERPTPPDRERVRMLTPVPGLGTHPAELALATPPPPPPFPARTTPQPFSAQGTTPYPGSPSSISARTTPPPFSAERAATTSPFGERAQTTPPPPPFPGERAQTVPPPFSERSDRKTLPLQPPRAPTRTAQHTPTGPQPLARRLPTGSDPVLGRVPTGPQMPRITFRAPTDEELADAPTHITGRRPERDDPTDVEAPSIPTTPLPRMPTATAQIVVKPRSITSAVVQRMKPATSSAARTWFALCVLFAIAVVTAILIAVL